MKLQWALGGAVVGAAAAVAWTEHRWAVAADPTEGRPLELPAGREVAVVSPDGCRLAAYDMGPADREPIVLAHGWTADRRIWGPVARRLVARGDRVVVWDERGHGGSGIGDAGLTMDALADDVGAVLDATGARCGVLAGHSMGGMAVLAHAVRHAPDNVGRLVLVATAARTPLLGSPGGFYERLALATVGNRRLAALGDAAWLAPWVARPSFGRHASIVGLRATEDSLARAPVETRLGLLREIARFDVRGELGSLAVPTTVVHGDRDRVVPCGRGREIAALVPGAVMDVLPGAGHQLPFERPDRLAAILHGEAAALFPRREHSRP